MTPTVAPPPRASGLHRLGKPPVPDTQRARNEEQKVIDNSRFIVCFARAPWVTLSRRRHLTEHPHRGTPRQPGRPMQRTPIWRMPRGRLRHRPLLQNTERCLQLGNAAFALSRPPIERRDQRSGHRPRPSGTRPPRDYYPRVASMSSAPVHKKEKVLLRCVSGFLVWSLGLDHAPGACWRPYHFVVAVSAVRAPWGRRGLERPVRLALALLIVTLKKAAVEPVIHRMHGDTR